MRKLPRSARWEGVHCSFPRGSVVENLPANARDAGLDPWVRETPWRRRWIPTPVFLPGIACLDTVTLAGTRYSAGYLCTTLVAEHTWCSLPLVHTTSGT